MELFGVITNRKRAIIVLIHSVAFFLLAASGVGASRPGLVHGPSSARIGGVLFAAMYLMVTSILLVLLKISVAAIERAYFLLCSGSAAVAFVRTLTGEFPLHAAQVLRTVLLGAAVVVATLIVRMHAEPEPQPE